jgi:colicin import membrane protein
VRADIAVEAEKKREAERQRLERSQRLQAERQTAEREKAEATRAEKARQAKAAAEKAAADKVAAQKAATQKAAAEKAAATERAERAERAAQEKRLAQQREENLRRIQQEAGETSNNAAPGTGTAAANAGPSANYSGRLVALIRSNIVFTGAVNAVATAEVEVRAGPSGSILSRRLLKSSGQTDWDEAVLRAIDRTGTLPRDTDGRVPPVLIITFRPRE